MKKGGETIRAMLAALTLFWYLAPARAQAQPSSITDFGDRDWMSYSGLRVTTCRWNAGGNLLKSAGHCEPRSGHAATIASIHATRPQHQRPNQLGLCRDADVRAQILLVDGSGCRTSCTCCAAQASPSPKARSTG
jgi:hypothetical protein